MTVGTRISSYSHSGGIPGFILRLILRLLQFVIALALCAVYALDVWTAHRAGIHVDGRWALAIVVSGLSCLSCLIYAIPFVKSYWFWAWDSLLFVLWVAVFGIFGKLFIKMRATTLHHGIWYDGIRYAEIRRMKHAVWVDLICMVLWLITAVYGLIIWKKQRASRHTIQMTQASV